MTDPQIPNDDTRRSSIAALPGQAIDTVRETAAETARRTADTIEGNPLSVLVGGLAVGVLAGALIPKSAREVEALKPVGKRLTQGAGMAARAARDAGLAELAAAGISRDAAREQMRKLVGSVVDAAKSAGDAAAKAARKADVKDETATDASAQKTDSAGFKDLG
ncbi:MAG: hypothetical protein C0500_12740 [Sphingobium sp.]|nr:hypothetical protein [Sphingobium sp.]